MSSETIVGEKEETSALHRVFIDENERKVIACRVSAIPYNVWWQGRQRPETQSEEASFVSFEFTAPVQVPRKYSKAHLSVLFLRGFV